MTTHADRAKANFDAKLPIYLFDCYMREKEVSYKYFIAFELNEVIIKRYACHYLQAERHESIEEKPVDDIYNYIKKHKNDQEFKYDRNKYVEHFKNILTVDEFNNLISNKKCSYCGISKEQIDTLGRSENLYNKRADTRGYSLEVDRINPNMEYSLNNICMSCYWCNNAKTDEFYANEFKEIARGINKVWNTRMGNNSVHFPENSVIWKK